MSFLNYLQESVNIYNNIYKLLSNSLNDSNIKTDKIIYNYNTFNNIQDKFTDILDSYNTPINQIHPESWKDYVTVYNNGYSFFNIKLMFYIDNPNINEYKLIIDDNGVQKHYSFKQQSSDSLDHKIKISSDISIIFSDKIIDKIRNDELPFYAKFKFTYSNNKFPLLKIPFHIDRIYLQDPFWIVSILNNMDVEISLIKKKYLEKKFELYNKNKFNLNNSNINKYSNVNNNSDINLTKTFYN